MSALALKTNNEKQGFNKLDSRTFLYLLVVGNLAVFMMTSVIGEILLMGMIILLALLCGARDFSLKLGIAYLVLLVYGGASQRHLISLYCIGFPIYSKSLSLYHSGRDIDPEHKSQ